MSVCTSLSSAAVEAEGFVRDQARRRDPGNDDLSVLATDWLRAPTLMTMLAYDPASNPLNNNEWAFPLTECFHIAAMALSVGTIALVDLRLLGIGMKRQTASQLLAGTELWTLGGLALAIASGLLIFSTDPAPYLRNGPFLFKMTSLLVAIIYNYTIHRRVARGTPSPLACKLAGALSLALWCSLAVAGIFIAFV